MKSGQTFLSKPISLIMIIIVLTFFLMYLYQIRAEVIKRNSETNLELTATNTLLILVNSRDCLAYVPKFGGEYGYIISKDRLDEFSSRYAEIEPDCARNYFNGYRVHVKDLINGNEWEFGAGGMSKKAALYGMVKRNLPISIRYTETEVNPGRAEITLVSGDLERLAGKLDYLCTSELDRIAVYISYPMEIRAGEVCLNPDSGDAMCKKLKCGISDFKLSAPGRYLLSVKRNGIIEVSR